jgi:hypothetical protein
VLVACTVEAQRARLLPGLARVELERRRRPPLEEGLESRRGLVRVRVRVRVRLRLRLRVGRVRVRVRVRAGLRVRVTSAAHVGSGAS